MSICSYQFKKNRLTLPDFFYLKNIDNQKHNFSQTVFIQYKQKDIPENYLEDRLTTLTTIFSGRKHLGSGDSLSKYRQLILTI